MLATIPLVHAAPWRPSDPTARIRPMQETAERLLIDGTARSPTFRSLVRRLERSDVIVYVELRPDLPSAIGGTTRFLAATATDRLLHIRLNRAHNRSTLISLLGHELRHAVEVADAPGVRSHDSFHMHYQALGVRLSEGRFDSRAAQQTGQAVHAELLQGRSRDPQLARAKSRTEG